MIETFWSLDFFLVCGIVYCKLIWGDIVKDNMWNYFDNDSSNSSDSNGNDVKGKFRDRLKLIRTNRFKSVVRGSFESEVKRKFVVGKKCFVKKDISVLKVNNLRKSLCDKVFRESDDRFVRRVLFKIRETASDRNYDRYVRGNGKKKNKKTSISNSDNAVNDDNLKEELKSRIASNIKREAMEVMASLDVAYFDVTSLENDVDKEKFSCLQQELLEVKSNIDNIIKKYDITCDDSYDDSVIDDIISYRELVEKSDNASDMDYTLLDDFREVYARLEKLDDSVSEVLNGYEDTMDEIDDFDYDGNKEYRFYNLKREVDMASERLENSDYYISKQNEYLDRLYEEIEKINRVDYSIYKFKGVNNLFYSIFNYISLFKVRAFSGIVPGIFVDTLIAKRMIRNASKRLGFEKVDKVRYEAYNYDLEIRNRLCEIDFAWDMVNSTINEVDVLRNDLIREFGGMDGIDDTLKVIDDIRDRVVSNKYKLDVVRKRLVNNKKINDDKLVRVRKLNNIGK